MKKLIAPKAYHIFYNTLIVILLCISSVLYSGMLIERCDSGAKSKQVENDNVITVASNNNYYIANNDVDTILDVSAACSDSTILNGTNNNPWPPSKLLDSKDILSIVKYWLEFNCPEKSTCKYASLGQHLLHYAMNHNQTLLTVQVGAMDGKSNDPMYEMFVKPSRFSDLTNWLPVLIEPVPANYQSLTKTYADIAENKRLGCAIPIHAAVSYDESSKNKSCAFCRVNTADDAPDQCKGLADWMKLQIGTLDCEYSKKFHGVNFELCVLQDPLPCSSIKDLLAEKNISSKNIGMLQIDIEGYEYILLEGFFNETSDDHLPPVIHFEHKVMKYLDENNAPLPKPRLDIAMELLQSKGYVLYNQGEDFLALRISRKKS